MKNYPLQVIQKTPRHSNNRLKYNQFKDQVDFVYCKLNLNNITYVNINIVHHFSITENV